MQIKYILIAITIFIVAGLTWYVTYLNGIIQDRDNTILVQQQNESALNDYISMQADSIQNFSLFVADLQKDNENVKKEYRLLKSKYTILIDSIKVLNQPAVVDAFGNEIVISFEGRQGKVSYKRSRVLSSRVIW